MCVYYCLSVRLSSRLERTKVLESQWEWDCDDMMSATGATPATTARVSIRPQTLREAYDPPANVLEVDVVNPETHKIGNKRFTDYEVRLRVYTYFFYFYMLTYSTCICIYYGWSTLFVILQLSFFLTLKTNLPVFKIKESSVRRRFSDFEWLRNELEKGSKVSAFF